jgi:hypothetical protein
MNCYSTADLYIMPGCNNFKPVLDLLINGEIDVQVRFAKTPEDTDNVKKLLKDEGGLEIIESDGFNNSFVLAVKDHEAKPLFNPSTEITTEIVPLLKKIEVDEL